MLSVTEARERILQRFHPVDATRLPLDRAAGRVLSETITARTDLPLFDNSSVDGFAVRVSDLSGADLVSPPTLNVVSDIRAGSYSSLPPSTGSGCPHHDTCTNPSTRTSWKGSTRCRGCASTP